MTETTAPVVAPEVIHVNFDNKLDYKTAKFSFREVTDKDTGVKTKRTPVALDKLPVPSVEGIVAILQAGGKVLDLLLEAVQDVVIARARDVVNESDSITSDNFDYSSCDWNTIATLEKEDRRSAISKDVWEEFATNYIEVMPAVSGASKEQCANVAKILLAKFAPVKTKKDVIGKLKLRLSMFAEHTPRAEEFAECFDVLLKKAEKLLSAEAVSLEDNLGLDWFSYFDS